MGIAWLSDSDGSMRSREFVKLENDGILFEQKYCRREEKRQCSFPDIEVNGSCSYTTDGRIRSLEDRRDMEEVVRVNGS